MKSNLGDILNLVKIRFLIPGVTYVYTSIIASLVASKGVFDPINLMYTFLTSFFIITAIYVYNDVMDYDIDKVNKVNRPVAIGSVTKKDALILSLVLFLFGVISALRSIETLILSITLFLLGVLYSTPPTRLRNRFFIKHFMPGMGQFLSSLIGGTIAGNVSIQVVYLGFLMFITVVSGTPIFDIPDLQGDKAGLAKSIGVVYGPEFSLKFSIVGFLAVIVVTLVSFPFIGFNIIMPIMVTSTCLVFIWFTYGLLRKWQNVDYGKKTIKRIVGLNFLYQLAFVLGMLRI
jgi:geranylgeranylglycerol-phosphate geranylgeranyltransferase